MALLVGLTAEPIHNDDAHNADDDHGGEDKAEGEVLRFHAALLDRLPSVLFFQRSCKGVPTATISFIFPLLSLMQDLIPELRFIRAFVISFCP